MYDSTLAAAADQNGYFIYKINTNENGSITDLDTIMYKMDTNPYAGDDLSAEVEFSPSGDAIFVLDPLDLVNIAPANPEIVHDPFQLEYCSGWNLYRSLAVNDSNVDTFYVYALLKHLETDTTGLFDQSYSTSIVPQKCYDYIDGPGYIYSCSCDTDTYINDLSYYFMKLSFSDSLLTITNEQLGVVIYKENSTNQLEYFSSFDTPGTVESVFSNEKTIFAGLSNDQGCYIALLDDDGQVSSNLRIAEGYSIKDININQGLLALACGNDGVLLYDWNSGLNISPLGKISTA